MSNVTVSADNQTLPEWSERARQFSLKVLKEINRSNWELSIHLCGDKKIAELNKQYRKKDEPTDILSFNLGETVKKGGKAVYLPGDIVISLDTLQANSIYFNIPEDEELRRLLIHGILHLDGMEHTTADTDEPMLALQEKILNKLNKETIITQTKPQRRARQGKQAKVSAEEKIENPV